MDRSAILLAAAALAGCSTPTTALVSVDLQPGAPVPSALAVSVYDSSRALVLARPATAHVPGSIILELPPIAEALRVVVRGASEPPTLGGVLLSTVVGEQVRGALSLATATPDADGDEVPDDLDDCPKSFNPDQADGDANGVGDTCQGPGGGGPSLCGAGGLLVCDGFEGPSIDTSVWLTGTDNCAQMAIDTQRAYRGASSLHLRVTAQALSRCWVHWLGIVPQTLYVRGFYSLDSAPAGNHGLYGLYAGPPGGVEYDAIDGAPGSNDFFTPPGPSGGGGRASGPLFPVGKWSCVEWGVIDRGDGTADVRMWLDGVEAADARLPMGGYRSPLPADTSVWFGYTGGATGPLDAWLDELALSTTPIGCAR